MDIYGRRPTGSKGEYFRDSFGCWVPLTTYIREVAPDIARHCQYWNSNDGDGLNAEQSIALAHKLEAEIKSGRTEWYAQVRSGKHDADPDEPCPVCDGKGTERFASWAKCDHCNGSEWVRPWEQQLFRVGHVAAFVAFLRECGGFDIW
jgi:DnaJ-class molecular chaperone